VDEPVLHAGRTVNADGHRASSVVKRAILFDFLLKLAQDSTRYNPNEQEMFTTRKKLGGMTNLKSVR
jgi:hypothetical protein